MHDFLRDLQGMGVYVLVTSRCSLGAGLRGAVQLKLDPLTLPSGIALLHGYAGADVAHAEAEALVKLCQHNSLYLEIVGGLLRAQVTTPTVRTASSYCL